MRNAVRIINNLRDPIKTLRSVNKKLYFNNKDISKDAELWINSYVKGDFQRLGFVYADTLYNLSQE